MNTSLKQASTKTMLECNLKQACKDAIGMQVGRRREKDKTKGKGGKEKKMNKKEERAKKRMNEDERMHALNNLYNQTQQKNFTKTKT
jgi:hypothetical protein